MTYADAVRILGGPKAVRIDRWPPDEPGMGVHMPVPGVKLTHRKSRTSITSVDDRRQYRNVRAGMIALAEKVQAKQEPS